MEPNLFNPNRSKSFEFKENHELLFEAVDKLTKRAKMLGVTINGIVDHNGSAIELGADEEIFGGSLGKLPLAHMVLERFDGEEVHDIENKYVAKSGGGNYDLVCISRKATTEQLLEDMLMRSGNTPFRLFADKLGGADAVNQFYRDNGWTHTRVNTDEDGFAMLGHTTPREVLDQLAGLLVKPDDSLLVGTAQNALMENKSIFTGIRQKVFPYKELSIHNKTGEYNGDTDEYYPVPYATRHDAGLLEGPQGTVQYVLMTRSSMKTKGKLANMIVGQFGAELALSVGGPKILELGKLARRAAL